MDLQKINLGKVAITVEKDYYDSNKDYDRLVVVEVKDLYKTYISRKPVPAGTDINNREYWIPFSSLSETVLIDYNKHLADLTEELAEYIGKIEDNTTNINNNNRDITNINNKIKNVVTSYNKKNTPNGLVELNSSGFVPSEILPSFVDDVLEYDNKAAFPSTGEQGKIYVDKATSRTYRWSGTTYIQINKLELGETASTAYAGNKGKALKEWQDNKDATLPDSYVTKISAPINSGNDIKIPITARDKNTTENKSNDITLKGATISSPGIMSAKDKSVIEHLKGIGVVSHIADNNAFESSNTNVALNFSCKDVGSGNSTTYKIDIGAASTTKAGVMTAEDKTKLNGLDNYILPVASKTVLGGVKENSNNNKCNVSISSEGVLSAIQMITISYSNLKNLRDNNNLIPGMWYRISDYITESIIGTVTHHNFDIIVFATSINTLSEEALALPRNDDTYFTSNNCDLSKWKVWYCLDNDTTRFEWANTSGKGVIYRLIDEYGNDAPYDFKNIKTTHNTVYYSAEENTWLVEGIKLYTFSYIENLGSSTQAIIEDLSVTQRYPCRNNKIGPLITTIENDYNISTKQTINKITFVVNKDLGEYFENTYTGFYFNKYFICNNILTDCYNCYFGNYTYNNKISNSSVCNYNNTSDCIIENSTIILYIANIYKNTISNSSIELDSNFDIFRNLVPTYIEIGIVNFIENSTIYDSDISDRNIDISGANIVTSRLKGLYTDEYNIVSVYNSKLNNVIINFYNIIICMSSDIRGIIFNNDSSNNHHCNIEYSNVSDVDNFINNDNDIFINYCTLQRVSGSIGSISYSTLINVENITINSVNANSSYIINNCLNINISNNESCKMIMNNVKNDTLLTLDNVKGYVNIYIDNSDELIIEQL